MADTKIIDSKPLLLERFEVLGVLGEGAAGAVYKVVDKAKSTEVLALKVLINESAFDEHTRTRFKKEWEVSHEFEHSNLVKAFELIELDGAIAYTMEYVEGKDLATILRKRELSFKEIDSILGQLCDAIEYLHKRDVFHRDIKLENILLDNNGKVKLSDFGLIKVLSEQKLTKTGIILGTAQYMPPEYIKAGKYEKVSDVYAIGVVLYELLGGRRWLADKSGNEVIEYLIKSKFVFPRLPDDSIPQKYHAVLKNCLEPNMAKRYSSMAELRTAINSKGEPPSAKLRECLASADKNRASVYKWVLALAASAMVLASVGVASVAIWDFSSSSSMPQGTYAGELSAGSNTSSSKMLVQVGTAGVMILSGNFCPQGFAAFKTKQLSCGDKSYPISLHYADNQLHLNVFKEGEKVAHFVGLRK